MRLPGIHDSIGDGPGRDSCSPTASIPARPGAADTVKDAVDTANKLRGLFGR
ncbi:MAG: hypothetical protein OEV67_14950 [Betaproteobacteria bacterium]|nr:hypothetical protein [Betaproteobacteria bacterium]